MSRQLLSDDRAYYDMPLIYRNGQMTRVKLPEFSSSTLRNPEAYTDRIIDRSQSAMKASTSPTQKYNITSVSNTNNNTNNNNSHAINSQSPRIIYVSKQHTINPDLSNNAPTVNRNRVISISTMSEPSTPRMYSVHSEHKIERTYTNNQYNYTSAPMPSQMRKGSVSIIHYDTTNNHNDNSDDDYTNKREYNL
ncbi:unnamed protein product [Trichobilharzia regenti]|nr:unnamed protein product [Trichobilharzia regenti]